MDIVIEKNDPSDPSERSPPGPTGVNAKSMVSFALTSMTLVLVNPSGVSVAPESTNVPFRCNDPPTPVPLGFCSRSFHSTVSVASLSDVQRLMAHCSSFGALFVPLG